MQIKFNNGVIVDVLSVNGSTRFYQGTNRDSLEIQLEKGKYTLESLDALTANPENTKKLIILDGNGGYVHDNYTLRAELSVHSVQTAAETAESPATYEERVCIVLAQKTYAELELESLRETVSKLTSAK